MKKTYKKPVLIAESFELVEHVAAGCKVGEGSGASYVDSSSCAYYSDNIQVFTTNCDMSWIDPDAIDDGTVNPSDSSTWPLPTCYNAFIDGLSSAFVS